MSIEDYSIGKIIENATPRLKTPYSSDRSMKLFLDPNLMPLIPKREKLVPFSETASVLAEVEQKYKTFSELITRKILQNKVGFNFYNFTKKPNFTNRDILATYVQVLNSHTSIFVKDMTVNGSAARNFDEFYEMFLSYVDTVGSILPLTLYSTAKKNKTYFENTGLCISLKDTGHDDTLRVLSDFFYQVDNTNDYILIANKCGFEVDAANPYRMVYNPFRGKEKKDIKDFYKENFIDIIEIEKNFFSFILTTMYNDYKKNKKFVYSYKEGCERNILTTKQALDAPATLTTDKIIKLYTYTLFAERGLNSHSEKTQITRNAIRLAKTLDIDRAMLYSLGQVSRIRTTRAK